MNALLQPGLIEVRFTSHEELEPARQAAVLKLLRVQVREGATAVIFDLRAIATISPRVPNFWLDVVTELHDLTAVAVVSPSLVVRALTGAFAMACTLRRLSLEVEVFNDAIDAADWARERLPDSRLYMGPAWLLTESGCRLQTEA